MKEQQRQIKEYFIEYAKKKGWYIDNYHSITAEMNGICFQYRCGGIMMGILPKGMKFSRGSTHQCLMSELISYSRYDSPDQMKIALNKVYEKLLKIKHRMSILR